MSDQRTLLQRLQDPVPRRGGTEAEQLMRSVRDNLTDLFSTHRGSSEAEPEYGFPSLSVLIHGLDRPLHEEIYQHSVERTKREIRAAIRLFEPRIRMERIEVSPDIDDPALLRFEIYARLLLDGSERDLLHVSAVVSSYGQLEVA